MFIRDKPLSSSERISYKDYYRKDAVEKTLVVSLKGFDARRNWLAVNRQS
jgi:hypothetical protein